MRCADWLFRFGRAQESFSTFLELDAEPDGEAGRAHDLEPEPAIDRRLARDEDAARFARAQEHAQALLALASPPMTVRSSPDIRGAAAEIVRDISFYIDVRCLPLSSVPPPAGSLTLHVCFCACVRACSR